MDKEKDLPLTEAVYYILLILHEPNHGYGISKEAERMTHGRVVLGAGTMYGAIKTLVKKGWIRVYEEALDARKKKQYVITKEGKAIFQAERKRLKAMIKDGEELR